MMSRRVAVSVVSHGQISFVHELLHDINGHCADTDISVILTLNVPEEVPFDISKFGFAVSLIRNPHPKGFGANHNAAFVKADADVFCVINPDIRFTQNPFPHLLAILSDAGNSIVAPLVFDPDGSVEDSARRLPTPWSIMRKLFQPAHGPDYQIGSDSIRPDFVAGMFMLFPVALFRQLGGFDERYFLYYEDVDICCRARMEGAQIVLDPRVRVIHAARRESHRNPRYLLWHLRSMLRFFASKSFRACLSRSVNSDRQQRR